MHGVMIECSAASACPSGGLHIHMHHALYTISGCSLLIRERLQHPQAEFAHPSASVVLTLNMTPRLSNLPSHVQRTEI